MSVENDEAVIIFPIRMQAVAEEGNEAAAPKEGTQESGEAIERLTEFIETTDRQGLQTLSRFARNPSNVVQNELIGVLGKAGVQGALAVAIITTIIAAPEIIRAISKSLAVKGGPLNQDFHRFFEEETQRGIDRDFQFRRAVGLDVIITTESRGFILSDPGFVNNSLVDIDITRTVRLSSKETQYGYVEGM